MREDYGWDKPTDHPRGPAKFHYFVTEGSHDRHDQHSLCPKRYNRWVSLMNPRSGIEPEVKDQCKGCREKFIKAYGERA